MALRIIRKSASQSQVELIKGTGEGTPDYSLLCYLSSQEDLERLQQLLQNEEIQKNAECLIMKSAAFDHDLRANIQPVQHTIKLISDPKDALWTLRLRTLVQEAQTDICLFFPLLPESEDLAATIAGLVDVMQAQPQLGMVGPTLCQDKQIWAAGQDLSHDLIKHHLVIKQTRHEFCPQENQLFYLYQGLGIDDLPAQVRQVSGIPLPFCALRRSAYQSLSWSKSDWGLDWLAQDLAFGLRQKQYQMAVIPLNLPVDSRLEALLTSESVPEAFVEKWKASFRAPIFSLYQQHGWKQIGLDSFTPETNPAPTLQQYLEQTKAETIGS